MKLDSARKAWLDHDEMVRWDLADQSGLRELMTGVGDVAVVHGSVGVAAWLADAGAAHVVVIDEKQDLASRNFLGRRGTTIMPLATESLSIALRQFSPSVVVLDTTRGVSADVVMALATATWTFDVIAVVYPAALDEQHVGLHETITSWDEHEPFSTGVPLDRQHAPFMAVYSR